MRSIRIMTAIGRHAILWAVICLITGCASRSSRLPLLPYVAGASNSIRFDLPDLRATHDSVLALFRLPALRESVLPRDVRELRLSSNGGFSYSPVRLLRLVQTPQRTMGELYFWWPIYKGHALRQQEESVFVATLQLAFRGCEQPIRGAEFAACRVQFQSEPHWSAIAQELESSQAWKLPGSDQVRSLLEQRGVSISDDIGIRLERRRGSEYEIGWYYSPKSYDGLPGQQLRSFVVLLEQTRNWR